MTDEKKSNPDRLSSFESFGHGWDYLAKLQHNDLQPPPSLCGGIWARCSIAHIDTHDTENHTTAPSHSHWVSLGAY